VPTHLPSLAVEQLQWLAQRVVGPITQKTAIKATAIQRGQLLLLSVDLSCRPSRMRPCEPRRIRSESKINPLLHGPLCSIVHPHLGHTQLPLCLAVLSIITRRRTSPKAIRKRCPSLRSSYHLSLPTRTDHRQYCYRDNNWDHSFNLQKQYRHCVPLPDSRVLKLH
jgi:hypothetical protein